MCQQAAEKLIANMGSNLTENALKRAALFVSTMNVICKCFDQCSCVPVGTSVHATKSDKDDIAKVATAVLNKGLLSISTGRKHSTFSKIHTDPLHN